MENLCVDLRFDCCLFAVSYFWKSGERDVDIDVYKLSSMLKAKDVQLIDVREPDELQNHGAIEGAVNIPREYS